MRRSKNIREIDGGYERKCTRCRVWLSLTDFKQRGEGLFHQQSKCIPCLRDYVRIHKKKTYPQQKEKIKLRGFNRYQLKREHILKQKQIYYKKNAAAICAKRTENRPHYREYLRIYNQTRCKNDINFRLGMRLRGRVHKAIKSVYGAKALKSLSLLGASVIDVRLYLESLWSPGMTWDNYSYAGWHIDHKIPCSAFDLTKEEEQCKCFHYTNLQPLWAKENLSKGDKIPQ